MSNTPKQTKAEAKAPLQESMQESPPATDHLKELESLGLSHLLPERPPERPDRRLRH